MFTTRHFWDHCNRSARDWCFNNFHFYYWVVRDQMKIWTNNEKLWNFYFTIKRWLSKLFLTLLCLVFWGIISVIIGLLWIRYTQKKSFFQLLAQRRQIHNVHGLMCVKKWFLFTHKKVTQHEISTHSDKKLIVDNLHHLILLLTLLCS